MPSCFVPALLLTALAAPAGGAAACAGPEIAADTEVDERWPTATTDIRKHLAKTDGLDRCARVDLVAGTKEIVVVVTLRDGRTAIRRVARVEDLAEVVEALLVLPLVAEPPAAPAAPAAVAPAAVAKPAPVAPRPVAVTKSAPPRASGFEIGVGGSERAHGPSLHVGLGVTMHAHLTHGGWHVGVNARSDALNAPSRNANEESVFVMSSAVGVATGRRFRVGAFDLDALGGLALVVQQQNVAGGEDVRERFSPRANALVRLSQAGARVRAFVASDFEFGDPRTATAPSPNHVAFPFWSFGFTFGVLWSSQ